MITLGNGAVVYILYHGSDPYSVMGIRITDVYVDASMSSWYTARCKEFLEYMLTRRPIIWQE